MKNGEKEDSDLPCLSIGPLRQVIFGHQPQCGAVYFMRRFSIVVLALRRKL